MRARGLSRGEDGLSRLGYPLWSAVPTHLVNCRSLVSMLRWRMHMRVSAEPMSRVAPGKEASCMGRGLAGGLCSPGLGPLGGALFHKGHPCPAPITSNPVAIRDMGAILVFGGFGCLAGQPWSLPSFLAGTKASHPRRSQQRFRLDLLRPGRV